MFNLIATITRNANKTINIERNLGRWCIPGRPKYNETATILMLQANEDHCGACGDNLLNNTNRIHTAKYNTRNDDEINKLTEEDIYYYPYTM